MKNNQSEVQSRIYNYKSDFKFFSPLTNVKNEVEYLQSKVNDIICDLN